ncbi:MAG: hypothetical protein ACUZ8E_13065 [Candidatus Anammoxibacter sp.]
MIDLCLDLKKETERKFNKILGQYSNKEIFAQNVIEYEISELKKGIINMQIDLRQYENKYNLSSEGFSKKFESGELGDDEDYIIWAGIYEMFKNNKKRLLELE